MREILFRGKDNGVMSNQWQYGSADFTDKEFPRIIRPDRFGNKMFIPIDPNTVGQYTGLNDKNGKKIFEGDILHIVSECCNYNFKTSVGVKYGYKSGLYVDGEFDGGDFNEIGFAFDYWQNEDAEIEVIGNIHDNPELLEG